MGLGLWDSGSMTIGCYKHAKCEVVVVLIVKRRIILVLIAVAISIAIRYCHRHNVAVFTAYFPHHSSIPVQLTK